MTLTKILPFTKQLLKKVVGQGDVVVDATCGNGHDTLFLSELVGLNGVVYGFDIQQQAIDTTKQRLDDAGANNVKLILDSHAFMSQYIHKPIRAVMFNLGYLPHGDSSITTEGESTWQAILCALQWLHVGGLIIVVIYHGHDAGKVEQKIIEEKITTLDKAKTAILKYEFLNKKDAPYVIVIEKTRI